MAEEEHPIDIAEPGAKLLSEPNLSRGDFAALVSRY
jgi:hypothetical protein